MSIKRNIRRWLSKASCCFSSLLLIICFFLPVKGNALTEETLQVALLLKVAQFTQWIDRDDQEFKFCFYQGKGFEQLENPENSPPVINELDVRFVFLKQNAPSHVLRNCHLLFITESSAVETKQVLRRAIYSPVLTVSTMEGFANLGGMIELVNVDKRYNFRINLTPVRESKLNISAQLLEISTVLKEEN